MPAFIHLFAVCLLLSLPLFSVAQIDTLLQLPTVEISETSVRSQVTGGRTRNWDRADLRAFAHTNLAEWLGQQSGLYIKSYGSGSIATTSIRGGSAAHTSVLWNGLPIPSPMLGQLDFSLFPLGFIDRAQLTYGGNSAAWGSGAIGGVLSLSNEMPGDSTAGLDLRSTLGSFGFQDYQLSGYYRQGRLGFQTRLFYRSADNDFRYRIRPDLAEQVRTHAALQQSGILQSAYWKPDARQQLSIHVWAQQSDREIPPTTVQNQSLATQADRFIRTALHWKRIGPQMIWQARLGLFREIIDYRDEQIRLQALTGFWTTQAEVSGSRAWNGNHHLQFGITHNWVTARADAYARPPEQNRTAPFLVYRYHLGDWTLQFNLREEIVDGKLQPLVPGLGLEGPVSRHLRFRAKVSRNYRLPTLNDLYWQPGGNPDLLPESGWSQEAGLEWRAVTGAHSWSLGITAFNRHIDNWILWSRPDGQSFWSSNNITKVWSRGLEYRAEWGWRSSDWQLQLSTAYDYIRSTNEIGITSPKLERGEQLIYVPEHQAFGQARLQWRQLQLQYRHTYTGPVGSLNVGQLSGYDLGSTGLTYHLEKSNWGSRLYLQINNLWNVPYRVIERQPMPGRHFQLGLQLYFRRPTGSQVHQPIP
ncbi:TonB-dependent receptor plug domain-containing protein [Flavilitoribacter nigricans]|nr:TonB-dependent receptor [Flavilitoribacter nigricans]